MCGGGRGGGWEGSGESSGDIAHPQVAARLSSELDNEHDMWFVHVLVGDGLHANEAAARRLLARVELEPVGQLRYFLAAHTCSSRQANLVAKTAVVGVVAAAAAATGAESGREGRDLAWPAAERPRASTST